MESNDETIRMERIEKYLDGELINEERAQFEQMLRHDPLLAQEVENMKITRSLIRNYGLRQDLKNIHAQAMAERRRQLGGISLFQYTMRIAAAVVLLLVSFVAIQMASVSGASLYNRKYSVHPVSITRGGADKANQVLEQMKADYDEGDYHAVVNAYESNQVHSIPAAFMAGNAYLVLANASSAIQAFREVIQLNEGNAVPQYKEDAEYYLALAYLKNDQVDESNAIFRQIRQDPTHTYHDRANGWFNWQLRLLKWKDAFFN